MSLIKRKQQTIQSYRQNDEIKFSINQFVIICDVDKIIIAGNLKLQLQSLGYRSEVIFINTNKLMTHNQVIYIFVDCSKPNFFPHKYIVYQISKITTVKQKYSIFLKKSIACWISDPNMMIPMSKIISKNTIYCILVPYISRHINNKPNDDIDILYVCPKNTRTIQIFNHLIERYQTKIYDNDMTLIDKAKIILISCENNFEDIVKFATNRSTIIYETNIVDSRNNIFGKVINYVPKINSSLDNINVLLSIINDNTRHDTSCITLLEKQCLMNIHKNFVSLKILPNTMKFDVMADKIYCLHLLETPYRLHAFNNQKYVPNIEVYPAVKFDPGWKGCGLSYQNLILNAKQQNLETITICEDDCAFNLDFEEKYKIIKEFLSEYETWDIFVGCIANLPTNTIVSNVIKYRGITFVEINRMYSMVFNIYNKTSYNTILKWDSDVINNKNCIDIFLGKQNLKFITTYPFEFYCVNTNSTMWGTKDIMQGYNLFDRYNKMFSSSLALLKQKIDNWQKN